MVNGKRNTIRVHKHAKQKLLKALINYIRNLQELGHLIPRSDLNSSLCFSNTKSCNNI